MRALTLVRSLGLGALMAAAVAFTTPFAIAADPSSKVVYHMNQGIDSARAGLRNIANHLDAEPNAKIVVVTHGPGIDFLLTGAEDKNGQSFATTVQELKLRNVEFRVCQNTLTVRKIDRSKVSAEASIVPSGVAEIGRLQSKEGYVYLKP